MYIKVGQIKSFITPGFPSVSNRLQNSNEVPVAACNSSRVQCFFQVLPDLTEDQAQNLVGSNAQSRNQKIKVDSRAKNIQKDEEEKRFRGKGQYTKLPS